MEQTLKQRLQSVVAKIEARAEGDWEKAQNQEHDMHYHLIGWSSGGRHAIELIKDEFCDILDDQPAVPPSDEPVEPFHYIDNGNVLFRDVYGRFYFWDELRFNHYGPYGDIVKTCEQMRKHNESLNCEVDDV